MEVKKSPTPSPWEASLVYSKFWDRQGYTVKACLEQKGNKKVPLTCYLQAGDLEKSALFSPKGL